MSSNNLLTMLKTSCMFPLFAIIVLYFTLHSTILTLCLCEISLIFSSEQFKINSSTMPSHFVIKEPSSPLHSFFVQA